MDAIKHERMIEILRGRFDHVSATAVLECALAETRTAAQAAYGESDVDTIADWIERKRDRANGVAAILREEAHRGPRDNRENPAVRLLHAVGEKIAAVVGRDSSASADAAKADAPQADAPKADAKS